MSMKVGALCAGYGGLELGLPWQVNLVWVAETDDHASAVLERRFGAPNLGDVTEIKYPPAVDIITAGFPCQPVSFAGRGHGVDDERWLIDDVLRIAEEAQAEILVLENVSGIYTANQGEAFRRVVLGLAEGGWSAEWGRYGAFQIGAPHRRNRWFCVAVRNPDSLARTQARPLGPVQSHDHGGVGPGSDEGYSVAVSDAGLSRLSTGTGSSEGEAARLGGHGPDDDRGAPAADSSGVDAQRRRGPDPVDGAQEAPRHQGEPNEGRNAIGNSGAVAADPDGIGLEGRTQGHGSNQRMDIESGDDVDGRGMVDWGKYQGAVERWEYLLGRPAPTPVRNRRLSPKFVEWMMGLPEGWVTDVVEPRTHSLRILGNGVVPQQAHHAITQLVRRLSDPITDGVQLSLF